MERRHDVVAGMEGLGLIIEAGYSVHSIEQPHGSVTPGLSGQLAAGAAQPQCARPTWRASGEPPTVRGVPSVEWAKGAAQVERTFDGEGSGLHRPIFVGGSGLRPTRAALATTDPDTEEQWQE